MAGTKASRLTLTMGDGELLRYGDDESGHDARCRACGSLLYSLVRDGGYVHVAMGTLVDEPSIRPSMFDTLDAANRFAILFRIQQASSPAKRAGKIAEMVAMLIRGETPPAQGEAENRSQQFFASSAD